MYEALNTRRKATAEQGIKLIAGFDMMTKKNGKDPVLSAGNLCALQRNDAEDGQLDRSAQACYCHRQRAAEEFLLHPRG